MKNLLLICIIATLTSCSAQSGFSSITERGGKIGIGTTTPDELLTVKGKIHTQEVLVDLKGAVAPDFVFETYYNGTSLLKSSYRFPSLSEIENFIKKHHHLPEVPSAKEIKEDGLALKEMNLLLLQKIEELTLYTIEQQKQLNALQEDMEILQNKIKE